jgi:hypothetical protein
MEVRKLTVSGIEQFRNYLLSLRSGSTVAPPYGLLTDPGASELVPGNAKVELVRFDTRLDAAKYLDEALFGLELDSLEMNVGLWSWLSLYYFDQVCPPGKDLSRKPGRDYRHILDSDYRYGHRHLLCGAYLVYTVYGWREEFGKLMLATPLPTESQFHHELAARQNFVTNRGILESVQSLYFDRKTAKPKRGSLMKNSPGTLYRFIDVVQQLDLTYDLYSMTGEEVLDLLPSEFDRWRQL